MEEGFWVRVTAKDWWNLVVVVIWNDQNWRHNFRIRKETFLYHFGRLTLTFQCQITRMRAPHAMEKNGNGSGSSPFVIVTGLLVHQFGVDKSLAGTVVVKALQGM